MLLAGYVAYFLVNTANDISRLSYFNLLNCCGWRIIGNVAGSLGIKCVVFGISARKYWAIIAALYNYRVRRSVHAGRNGSGQSKS